MATINSLNVVTLLREALEREVKEKILNDIIDDQVIKLKERLKLEIEPILQAVTFESIEKFTDFIRLRDEYRIVIKTNDKVFDTDDT